MEASTRPPRRRPSAAAGVRAAVAGARAATGGKPRPQVRFRLRLLCGELIAIGPGKIALLEAVRDEGSISAAARSLGMSYRRAWLLLDETNRSLKEPAAVSEQGGQSGGGSRLTPFGETVVRLYRGIEAHAMDACAADIAALTRMLAKP